MFFIPLIPFIPVEFLIQGKAKAGFFHKRELILNQKNPAS
jgi:hypothetical protein